MAERSRQEHEEVGDIGKLPDVKNPQRRERAERDFALWRATYCGPRHDFADSRNHTILCDRLQEAIESKSGWFGVMAPRGEAKTTTCVESIGWSVASGRKKFPACFSSSAATNRNLVASFSSLFTKMPTIAEDYPEIWVPLNAKIAKRKNRRVIYNGNVVNISSVSMYRNRTDHIHI
ncbi:MAG TPA: hypothetical protein DEB39_06395 [Planctomycetaceae bacterium]|nr:hypothetical protein [Planctomycetaceae bacterium]